MTGVRSCRWRSCRERRRLHRCSPSLFHRKHANRDGKFSRCCGGVSKSCIVRTEPLCRYGERAQTPVNVAAKYLPVLRTPNSFGRLIAFGFKFSQKFVETVGQFFREHLRAMRIGADFSDWNTGVCRSPARRDTNCNWTAKSDAPSFGRGIVDCKRIKRRPDFF